MGSRCYECGGNGCAVCEADPLTDLEQWIEQAIERLSIEAGRTTASYAQTRILGRLDGLSMVQDWLSRSDEVYEFDSDRIVSDAVARLHRRQTGDATAIEEARKASAVRALERAALEGHEVIPDATDDQANLIEEWAEGLLWWLRCQP